MDRSFQDQSTSRREQHRYSNAEAPPYLDTSREQILLSEETRQLIRRKAYRLINRAGLPRTELDGVMQSLHWALVRDSRTFDPQKGEWLAFAERALQYASNNLLRHDFAGMRDRRRNVSLHILVNVEDEGCAWELAQLITRKELEARTGGSTTDEFRRSDLRIDTAEFKATLPPKLRELADALERETILNISRRTGVPRSTIYDHVDRLRKLAEDAGLAKYVE